MGKILQTIIIENRDLAHAQTFCTRFAAILVFQTNPVRVGLFSYVKNFFCSRMLATRLNTFYTKNVKFGRDLLAINEEYRYAKSPNFREVCVVGANLCLHHTNV